MILAEVLEKIRQGANNSGMDSRRVISGRSSSQSVYESGEGTDKGRVNDHVGTVQFNMGEIRVGADDM